jgi:hypothetical protein
MTPLSEAAKAVELVETLGYSSSKAGLVLGLAKHSVTDIINGVSGWNERKQEPLFARYRQEQKAILIHAMTQLTRESLIHASQNLHKASYSQAIVGSAILIDKTRLLAGEPTEITASIELHAVGSLDKLANLLSQSLVGEGSMGAPMGAPVDITPTKV